jgi:ATP-dependent exoDNAse (exonuclease V) alpha subunit
MNDLKLNEDQQLVFELLKKFLVDKKVNTFILNGYAGTGKTFLMQYLAEYMKKKEISFKMLATTGRAASVLKGKLDLTVKTVHSNTYTFSEMEGAENTYNNPDSHHGQLFLNFALVKSNKESEILIVDEASMLSNVQNNVDHTAKFGSGVLLDDFLEVNRSNKIIFVGDPLQLPPVGQNDSPALSTDVLTQYGRLCIRASLEKIMRTHNDNDILEVAHDIRKYVESPTNSTSDRSIDLKTGSWPHIQAIDKNNITVYPTVIQVFERYKEQFLLDKKSCIAITNSNRATYQFNLAFRKHLYGDAFETIRAGEILLVTQNNYIRPLTNGDFIEILSIEKEHIHLGFRFMNVRLRVLTSGYECEIMLNLDAMSAVQHNFTKDQHQRLMADFTIRMKNKNVKPNTDVFKENLLKDEYLNSLKCTYGYFITCHKSQGGEWPYVFILADKAMRPIPDHITHIKWWYTALTRAKEQVYLNDGYWIQGHFKRKKR